MRNTSHRKPTLNLAQVRGRKVSEIPRDPRLLEVDWGVKKCRRLTDPDIRFRLDNYPCNYQAPEHHLFSTSAFKDGLALRPQGFLLTVNKSHTVWLCFSIVSV